MNERIWLFVVSVCLVVQSVLVLRKSVELDRRERREHELVVARQKFLDSVRNGGGSDRMPYADE